MRPAFPKTVRDCIGSALATLLSMNGTGPVEPERREVVRERCRTWALSLVTVALSFGMFLMAGLSMAAMPGTGRLCALLFGLGGVVAAALLWFRLTASSYGTKRAVLNDEDRAPIPRSPTPVSGETLTRTDVMPVVDSGLALAWIVETPRSGLGWWASFGAAVLIPFGTALITWLWFSN